MRWTRPFKLVSLADPAIDWSQSRAHEYRRRRDRGGEDLFTPESALRYKDLQRPGIFECSPLTLEQLGAISLIPGKTALVKAFQCAVTNFIPGTDPDPKLRDWAVATQPFGEKGTVLDPKCFAGVFAPARLYEIGEVCVLASEADDPFDVGLRPLHGWPPQREPTSSAANGSAKPLSPAISSSSAAAPGATPDPTPDPGAHSPGSRTRSHGGRSRKDAPPTT